MAALQIVFTTIGALLGVWLTYFLIRKGVEDGVQRALTRYYGKSETLSNVDMSEAKVFRTDRWTCPDCKTKSNRSICQTCGNTKE